MNNLISSQSALPTQQVFELLNDYFSSLKAKTREAYAADLQQFARFIQCSDAMLIPSLVSLTAPEANHMLLKFKNSLLSADKSPATINRKLASVRSFIRFLKSVGVLEYEVSIKNVRKHVQADVSGVKKETIDSILQKSKSHRNPVKAKRDYALLILMYSLALRRHEVVSLNVSDFDFSSQTMRVLRKARNEKQVMIVPLNVLKAIEEYLAVRSSDADALFLSLSKDSSKRDRLTVEAVYYLVRHYAGKCGAKNVHPHSFRATAITEASRIAMSREDMNVRDILDFSNHTSMNALTPYLKRVEGKASKIAETLSAEVA